MPSLDSSCLTWVEYDPFTGTMELTFRSGRHYTLRHVPSRHYHGLLTSDSPGWYFNACLKGRY